MSSENQRHFFCHAMCIYTIGLSNQSLSSDTEIVMLRLMLCKYTAFAKLGENLNENRSELEKQ